MIKTYLFELLKVNSRVIVPDLGAFLVKEKPGGKMVVSFNDFLKFNDGLLANKIIKTEGISKTDANKMIKEFIKELEDGIKDGAKFTVENVGVFYKDDFGRIKFDAYKPKDTDKEEPKKEAPANKKEEEKPAAKPEEKKEEPKPAKPASVKKEEPKVEDKKPEPAKAPPKEKKADVKLADQITAKVAKEEPKKDIPKTKEEPKPNVAPVSKPTSKKVSKQKGSATLVWVSAIVVVVAAAITWAVLDYERIAGWFDKEGKEVVEAKEKPVPEKTVKKEVKPAGKVASTKEENKEDIVKEPAKKEPVKEEPVKEAKAKPVEKPKAKPANRSKKYYVVAGSFKVEQNAIEFQKKLVKDGYKAENLGLIKGFYIVTFDSFPSLTDAAKMQKMVLAEQPDAWVMKY